MRGLTKNIGATDDVPKLKPGKTVEVKRILISRPNNRLGNLLLITPLLQELQETFPQAKVDLFVRGGLAPKLFKNYSNVDRIIQLPGKPFKHLPEYISRWVSLKTKRYDLVINVVKNSSSGRLSTQFVSSKLKIFGDLHDDTRQKFSDHVHVAKYPVYNLRRYLGLMGYPEKSTPVPALDLKLTDAEIAEGAAELKKLTGNDRKSICIFTFATGHKCYPESWWMPFYEKLRNEFPDYNIVEALPFENVSQINFIAPSHYSTNIRILGAFIKSCDIFIGADSGIMHLASAAHAPTVGLFSVTDPVTFGPYSPKSTSINTNEGTPDDWIAIIKSIIQK